MQEQLQEWQHRFPQLLLGFVSGTLINNEANNGRAYFFNSVSLY